MADKHKNILCLQKYKQNGQKITCLTAYDATFARAVSAGDTDCILVGDSLGMVLHGQQDTLGVDIEDMAYHTHSVSQGNLGSVLIADMPFMSYATPEDALENAKILMQSGAHCVKMEGGDWLVETVQILSERGIPVCGHLGLLPQSVHQSGYAVQGRDREQAQRILADALALQEAGASLLVLECLPGTLGKLLSEKLRIPTIGIGAGVDTDGQVLVLHDMLGLTSNPARFVKDFMQEADNIQAAIALFNQEVRESRFPTKQHCYD